MKTEQQMVQEFMTTFGQEVKQKPEMSSLAVRILRANLILEETLELIDALGFTVEQMSSGRFRIDKQIDGRTDANLELIADGLADLHYVAYCGTALACGLDMEPIFAEVHRSNMSKLWTGEEVLHIAAEMQYKVIYVNWEGASKQDRVWLVKNKDGKVIKSPSYSPADIKAEIDKQLI